MKRGAQALSYTPRVLRTQAVERGDWASQASQEALGLEQMASEQLWAGGEGSQQE